MLKNQSKKILMGTCNHPHGIKGEFSFKLLNIEESSLNYIKNITLIPLKDSSLSKSGEEFEIEKIKINKKTICKLKGIESRNQAESMLPFQIYINREDLKELSEDEIYLEDLIGLDAFYEDMQGAGKVTSYYDNGVQTILVISLDQEKIEVPFVDAFVKELKLKENKIVIKRFDFI